MNPKCPCEKCGVNIEFPNHDVGTTVKCPQCGELTFLINKSNDPSPNQLHYHAARFTAAAWAFVILAGLAVVLTILCFCGPHTNDELTTIFLDGGAVTGACLSLAAVLYLIGQTIHIRANTERDSQRD